MHDDLIVASYNNERSGILIFCLESLCRVCQIKKSSERLIDGHLGGLDLIDAYVVYIKKKRLVERVDKKVSIQIRTLKRVCFTCFKTALVKKCFLNR